MISELKFGIRFFYRFVFYLTVDEFPNRFRLLWSRSEKLQTRRKIRVEHSRNIRGNGGYYFKFENNLNPFADRPVRLAAKFDALRRAN